MSGAALCRMATSARAFHSVRCLEAPLSRAHPAGGQHAIRTDPRVVKHMRPHPFGQAIEHNADLLFGRVCFRVARRMLRTSVSDDAWLELDLSHLRFLRATMSQKSSVPQAASFVSQVLKRDIGRRLLLRAKAAPQGPASWHRQT